MSSFPKRISSSPPGDPMATWDRPLRVQFIHGLQMGPSLKAAYLDRFFEALSPEMDTSDFEGSVALQATHAAEFAPDVLVGSSFGGAVALALLQRGLFRGPTALLAPAHGFYGVPARIPDEQRVLIVHGVRDDVVPIDGSRELSRTGTPGLVELVEVEDEHRLRSLLEGDAFAALVRRTLLIQR